MEMGRKGIAWPSVVRRGEHIPPSVGPVDGTRLAITSSEWYMNATGVEDVTDASEEAGEVQSGEGKKEVTETKGWRSPPMMAMVRAILGCRA